MKQNCFSFTATMRIFVFYILFLKFKNCFNETLNGGYFQQNKKMGSRIILTRDNIGPKMCIRECLRINICKGINIHKDSLQCELLSDSNLNSQLVSAQGYSYSNITDWKMATDCCWPSNPCPEKTRCVPSKSNAHVCLKYDTSNEIFVEIITSPGFPDVYDYNLNETWKIEVGVGNRFALEFTYFDVEKGYDFVKVFDCGTNIQKPLGSFTGKELPKKIQTTSNCIVIILTTDDIVNTFGFSANVYKIIS
ncbi:uncharacterized protein LOC134690538 [Mytilus trossulus]|uniref:uncharacterized protein LOC134690538 n=1 Tax=Mytilus trossulus TaxID=6551 RepID=UPI003006DCF7